MAIKTKAKRPPLSALDKTLYFLAMMCAIVLCFGVLLLCGFVFPRLWAFRDPEVIASYQVTAIFMSFPMIALFTFVPGLLVAFQIDKRQPLFGNKKYKPKWSEVVIVTTPLFSKRYFTQLSDKQKKKILTVSVVLLALFAIFLLLMLMGWNYRVDLCYDGAIKEYNVFGNQTKQVQLQDADSVTIRIDERWYKTQYVYDIHIEVTYQDKTYACTKGDFSSWDEEQKLIYLLHVKSLAKDQLILENEEYIEDLIRSHHYTESEKQLIYELFDLNR